MSGQSRLKLPRLNFSPSPDLIRVDNKNQDSDHSLYIDAEIIELSVEQHLQLFTYQPNKELQQLLYSQDKGFYKSRHYSDSVSQNEKMVQSHRS